MSMYIIILYNWSDKHIWSLYFIISKEQLKSVCLIYHSNLSFKFELKNLMNFECTLFFQKFALRSDNRWIYSCLFLCRSISYSKLHILSDNLFWLFYWALLQWLLGFLARSLSKYQTVISLVTEFPWHTWSTEIWLL